MDGNWRRVDAMDASKVLSLNASKDDSVGRGTIQTVDSHRYSILTTDDGDLRLAVVNDYVDYDETFLSLGVVVSELELTEV